MLITINKCLLLIVSHVFILAGIGYSYELYAMEKEEATEDVYIDTESNNREAVLLAAVKENNIQRVIALLDSGAYRDARASNGDTALICAIKLNHIGIAQLLIEKGADKSAKSCYGNQNTVLLWAVNRGHTEIVNSLLQRYANVDAQTHNGDIALTLAAKMGHKDVVALLLNLRRNRYYIHTQGQWKHTALEWAACLGRKEVVKLLIERGANVNDQNDYRTVLMLAAEEGHTEIVQMLIEAGADVNTERNGNTALMLALKKRHQKTALLLIERGADIDIRGSDYENGLTPLMYAAEYNCKEVATALLKKSINKDAQGRKGATALMIAVSQGHKKMIELLLEHKVAVNMSDTSGKTALMVAAEKGYKEIVALLLHYGADVTIQDKLGDTALLIATGCGYKGIVKLLLKARADSNVLNKDGDTALMKVLKSDKLFTYEEVYKEILIMLVAAGANVSSTDKNKNSALDLAEKKMQGKFQISRILRFACDERVQTYLKDPLEDTKRYTTERFFERSAKKRSFEYCVSGQTRLMLACIFGHGEVISFFKDCPLEYLNIKDGYGYTAFDYALQYNPSVAAQLIYTFGMKIDDLERQKLDRQRAEFFTNCIRYSRYSSLEGTEYKQALLKYAVDKRSLKLVNALLALGAKSSLELAHEAFKPKVQYRLLFSYLASLPEYKRAPYYTLCSLFK